MKDQVIYYARKVGFLACTVGLVAGVTGQMDTPLAIAASGSENEASDCSTKVIWTFDTGG